jgi:hypothetical protein
MKFLVQTLLLTDLKIKNNLQQGFTNFPKIYEPPLNSICQKGYMKQVLYWGTTIPEWRVNLSVTVHIVLCAHKKYIFLYVRGEKLMKILDATIQNAVSQNLCIPNLQDIPNVSYVYRNWVLHPKIKTQIVGNLKSQAWEYLDLSDST